MRFSTFYLLIFITIALACVPHTTVAEQVYRWVDENGVVHFGDRAPELGDAEKVAIQPSSGAHASPASEPNSPYAEATDPQPSVAQQLREERAAKRQENEQLAEATAEMCKLARNEVAQLEPSPRVNVTHEDGTVTRMDDNQRLKRLDEAKAFITENCDK